jgi:naphthalene 1,2-dioxygenase system ferredoxin subunit
MSSEQWHDLMPEDELPHNDVWAFEVAGHDIALYGIKGEPYATDNLCTHGYARLCDGFLDGYEIECPLHQGRFDVRDGRPTCAPVTEAVKTYPVRIEAGRILLKLS